MTNYHDFNTKPHMFYWYEDEEGSKWELLLEGEYEKYEDGNNIVSELYVKYYAKKKTSSEIEVYVLIPEQEVPDEVLGFAEMLMDDHKTSLEIQREYESEGRHLL